jgi:NAD(P)-dependent dehydrogenase (short-subunit alcohol dehydrogenase family)
MRTQLGVVTGASRGFGLEVARELAANGWDVITVSRGPSAALDAISSITSVRGDVTDMDLDGLLRAVGERPVDLLVNNAGVGGTGRHLHGLDRAELDGAFAVHVWGPARISGALLPSLRRSARPLVVNVSSRLASLNRQAAGEYQQLPTSYAYRVTKAAQNMLSICMANELGPSVRVWAVHPGRLRTALAPADADVEPADAARRLVALVRGDTKTPLSYLSLEEGPLPW